MSLANYTDLQTAIINFSHRSDLASIVPDIITLAEVRINGDLDARLQDTETTLTTVTSTETVALPSDCINIRTLYVSSTSPNHVLTYETPDAFRAANPWATTGIPQNYTIVGSNILFAPIPDDTYTLDIIYKARVPSLAANTTNYLMTTYPNVYLYASLCELAPYLKDDQRVALWETKYKESISTVNNQDWANAATMKVRTDTFI